MAQLPEPAMSTCSPAVQRCATFPLSMRLYGPGVSMPVSDTAVPQRRNDDSWTIAAGSGGRSISRYTASATMSVKLQEKTSKLVVVADGPERTCTPRVQLRNQLQRNRPPTLPPLLESSRWIAVPRPSNVQSSTSGNTTAPPAHATTSIPRGARENVLWKKRGSLPRELPAWSMRTPARVWLRKVQSWIRGRWRWEPELPMRMP